MAGKFVSPGVFTSETDQSQLPEQIESIGGALVVRLPRGPVTPWTVSNYTDFANVFGDLNTKFPGTYLARAYLRWKAPLTVVRVLAPDNAVDPATNSAITPGYSVAAYCIEVSGASNAVQAVLHLSGNLTASITDLASGKFYLSISSSTLGVMKEATGSFLTGANDYIKKVFNTEPTSFKSAGYYVHQVFDFNAPTLAADPTWQAAYMGSAASDFTYGYRSGSTPWIFSQPFAATEHYLFRLHTLGVGEAEVGRLKIAVENIKASADIANVPYGTFDVVVRAFNDSDKTPVILEAFRAVNLNPEDRNFIGRRIGDRHIVYNNDTTVKKLIEYGDFDNKSKYIWVELTTGSWPETALPWGHVGFERITGAFAPFPAIPYVSDQLDNVTGDGDERIHWGLEFNSGSKSISEYVFGLPEVTAGNTVKNTSFSLKSVSGSSAWAIPTLKYVTTFVSTLPGTINAVSVLGPESAKFNLTFAGGFDGFDRTKLDPLENDVELNATSKIGVAAIRESVDMLAPEVLDMSELFIPGIYSNKVTDYALAKAQDRGDTFYVLDISGAMNIDTVRDTFAARSLDTSYGAAYYPPLKWDDRVNNRIVEVPASVVAAAAIAYTDKVGAPWWAPAGLARGGVKTILPEIVAVKDKLKFTERNKLQEVNINPIAVFPREGIAVWGQKTLQLADSALNRVNVRRMLLHARKTIASAAAVLVFEPNNSGIWDRFKNLVNPILEDIKRRNGVEEFKIIMDSSNNPPDVIDRNEVNGTLLIKPTKTAEIISLDFVVTSQGATFNE